MVKVEERREGRKEAFAVRTSASAPVSERAEGHSTYVICYVEGSRRKRERGLGAV